MNLGVVHIPHDSLPRLVVTDDSFLYIFLLLFAKRQLYHYAFLSEIITWNSVIKTIPSSAIELP